MSEERFNRIETKLDGVVADVAVLKIDVTDLKVGQTSMEERLTARMLMLYEDTKATMRTMHEEYREVPKQVRALWELIPGIRAALTSLEDSNRHFARVLDNHERRITDLEKQPGR